MDSVDMIFQCGLPIECQWAKVACEQVRGHEVPEYGKDQKIYCWVQKFQSNP
jgi:hypothetical protein